MHGCENWIIKKAERWRIDAFWTVVLEKTLESPLDCKEIQPVHPKGDQSGCSLEGLMLKLKLQYFGLLMWRADSFEKTLLLRKIGGRRRRGWQRMRWLDGITDSNGHRFGWTPGVGDGQGGLVCCGSWGRNELDTTEWLNWTELNQVPMQYWSLQHWTLHTSPVTSTTGHCLCFDSITSFTETSISSL